MQQYNLTEEQSDIFYHHMFLIDEFALKINSEAIDILKKWYSCYNKNKKWYWFNRNIKSFLKTITYTDSIELIHSSIGYSYLTKHNSTMMLSGFKVERISKLTGLSLETILYDIEKIWKTIELMHKNMSFIYRNYDIFTDVRQYHNKPYVLDEKYYNHMEVCSKLVDDWNLEGHNEIHTPKYR
ncbi:hypothetical protein [Escherichia coli]|uniref:Uncharacterized protein n=3 Tax=Asteriusvirus PBECO4 TaxID=2560463 RepID=A0A1C3S6V9_9CAUD|nr:hypothetical protein [Escherichia coli]YP_009150416.1 hypothetical protein ACQ29_gp102 [Escherichia phage PBECO4]MED6536367.1 hypothetical protein [Escherichia coli O157]QBO61947.1 hypothetical protein G17_00458 [Escherichia phage vB_EcoM_G17]QDF13974.1 hypothetical protein vBEcoMphAPEC6_gp350c [Escherichia phage vB_EcoM_phAPEC6]QXN76184.1 hypothetical protein [Escherichia phage BF17]WIL00719.1 hypothetical protein [Escherichia phage vB_EcoM_CRJP21]WNN14774.1 hypothetical protein Sharanji